MTIRVFNGKPMKIKSDEIIFYVQNKGFNAGKPLKKSIANCWEVKTNRSVDFEILSIVFESKILNSFIKGSVIPFITLKDYKNIIFPILSKSINNENEINNRYLQIRMLEDKINNNEKIKNLLIQLKSNLAKDTFRKINAH